MPYIGPNPAESFTSFATQEFSTSATTSYTLDHAVANENEIALFVNNVRQQPGSGKAYTATGTALTLSAATASTDTMYCVFLGRALQTVTPATNSITAAMVGNDLISGKTALGAEPADTDEFLVSDAGTLKRVDYSYIKGGGITEADQWRLTTDNAMSSSGNTDITSNWERNDNSGFGLLGSGMTESSGIFTFPSTGIYLIKIIYDVIGGSQADSAVDAKINTTVNNSDYTQQTATYASMHSNGVYSVGMAEFIFDVTDTSTHKCKFRYYRSTSGTILRGSTDQNETHATFIRLGDT